MVVVSRRAAAGAVAKEGCGVATAFPTTVVHSPTY